MATLWLSVIVLIPLAAVVARSLDGGLGAFWDAVTAIGFSIEMVWSGMT